MEFLIDTNILSELRKQERCNSGVQQWYATVDESQIYLSVITLGEIRRGVELLRRRDTVAAENLEYWLSTLRQALNKKLLPITPAIVDIWGRIGIPDAIPTADGLLAATAVAHNLILVTRNVRDMERTGAKILNPFTDDTDVNGNNPI